METEETKALYKALGLFRKNIKHPVKDGKNPYFKSSYVTLEDVSYTQLTLQTNLEV